MIKKWLDLKRTPSAKPKSSNPTYASNNCNANNQHCYVELFGTHTYTILLRMCKQPTRALTHRQTKHIHKHNQTHTQTLIFTPTSPMHHVQSHT